MALIISVPVTCKGWKIKVTVGVFLIACFCVAQSETVTFTNTGSIVSNAVVVRVDHNRLIYRTPEGGGSIKLSELPTDLQEHFGYDPAQAAADERLEKANAERERNARESAARAAALRRLQENFKTNGVIVWGKVIQRVGEKLLIDADTGAERSSVSRQATALALHSQDRHFGLPKEWQDGIPQKWNIASGTVLLVDHPRTSSIVDSEIVLVVAYPTGTYEYTAVSGARKTIRKYTASLDNAFLASLVKD